MTSLRWPMLALLAWGACWGAFAALRAQDTPAAVAVALATLLGAAIAFSASTPWRRLFIASGFPLSLALSGAASGLPGWAWLAPLAALAILYPVGAWRDAPLFPTPKGALRGLAAQLSLPADGRFLDAGCGLGDALIELRREFPRAALSGIEWSGLLRLLCSLRCRFASVRRADMWSADWSGFDLVYVFQRPESMERVIAKASGELRPGAWLASLEFEVGSRRPTWVFVCADGRPLWLYRMTAGR
ncbi:MAG: class I SAM-dependent methyltransferase [Burkholderiales bacterium]|nr:class I SAM-dependent methyltransferase [Burkholderiales bacterium]